MQEFDPSKKPCPDCGGERVFTQLQTGYGAAWLTRIIQRKTVKVETHTLTCTICGYTSLYAKDPQKLEDKTPDKPIKKC